MDIQTKEKALKRLAIVEGHLKKVRQMVQDDQYCLDVIHQSRAVQAALRKNDELILEGHLHCCVLNGKTEKNQKVEMVDEIVELFRKNGH